jgi:CBS domain-containing protein
MKPLLQRTADDLMSREVTVLPEHMSLRAAAHLLSQAQISGAPVVDEQGRCIGVISATDFVQWAQKPQAAASRPDSDRPPCICSEWQVVDWEDLPTEEVREYMTSDPVLVTPGTPIDRLAQIMIDAHIHRVIVVNRERRPIGIVSSTDILAAVARAGLGG